MEFLRRLGSFLGICERSMPRFAQSVSWETYLLELDLVDRANVETICKRLALFSQKYKLPLAIVSVGSVLNKKRRRSFEYGDVDLLLLPIRRPLKIKRFLFDINPEGLLAQFVETQPELPHEGEWVDNQVVLKSQSRTWRDDRAYEISQYWTLFFPVGKELQLFVKKGPWKMTLRQFIHWENDRSGLGVFAYKIIK